MNQSSLQLESRVLQHRGFSLRSTLGEDEARRLLDDLLEKSYTVTKTFRDSRSTFAARTQAGEENLVYKVSRARFKRTWEKIVTLIRDSEGFRIYDNLHLMTQLGFQAPVPVLAGESDAGDS